MQRRLENTFPFLAIRHLVQQSMGTNMLDSSPPDTILYFAYGKYLNNESFVEQGIQLLEQIKPENNHIIRLWKNVDCKWNMLLIHKH